ncbi:hypothetical protein BDL97_06G075300 [Sphagnum fallax]|nr:hypothetical protein BDL97_06G075300 [Sphagnum fallax]KAH8959372.1 hypothetical protein BDL97_06G075300 [Sphagnum fallax]
MARGCSHCGHNGHNSRTCPDRGVRLFGVRLTDGVMRKSVSMSNLSHYASVVANPPSPPEHSGSGATPDGYVSDGLVQTSNNARERKKGVPWTEEEHRLFLLGLQKLGKGDWRGISRNFVQTRTPTQVASHAQKYFIRQSNLNKRKRRSSLFDIISETGPSPMVEEPIPNSASDMAAPLPQLSLGPSSMFAPGLYYDTQGFGISVRPFGLPTHMEGVPTHMEATVAVPMMSLGNGLLGASTEQSSSGVGLAFSSDTARPVLQRPVALPSSGAVPPNGPLGISNLPYAIPMWSGVSSQAYSRPANSPSLNSKVVRPTASIPTAPVKIDEAKEVSQLSLGLSPPEPSQLTLKLLDPPSRHSSAFHVNSSFSSSSISSSSNAISVV